ncbi:hypothetical protein [Candidatus Thalassolituus haligoni]|uniref:hypothetical protein n=1 Tax=Candidatus Thalassolituus haligoni TaxID=3100113 RepID=UPI003515D5D2|tara:strand:- start:512 stop:703 length:192 start_codon:yes stop_codon:yes gene_type:complete
MAGSPKSGRTSAEQCGFNVELEKKIETVRGDVELDVYAEEVIKGRKYSIAVECKNWRIIFRSM